MFIHFCLVDIRHFQKYTVVHFLPLSWRLLWPSALGSRLVCLNVAPALFRQCYSKEQWQALLRL